jgi:hypothetical protein
MKTWTKGILTSLLMGALVFASLPAFAAGPSYYHLNHRGIRFQHRIYRGLWSGRLTPREARHLEHQRHRFRLAEARMRAHHWGRAHYRYRHQSWRPGWH